MKQFLPFFLTLITLTFSSTAFSFANTNGSNGQCPAPGGTLQASYVNGWHWVVGNSQNQWGSDSVYSLPNNNFSQCFCPLSQNNQVESPIGTQTDWLYAGNLTNTQIQNYLAAGWQKINDGTVFGLPAGVYLARNSNFLCGSTGAISGVCLHISQNNSTTISNTITTTQNTGGNAANQNTSANTTISTGNATSSTTISNTANGNIFAGMLGSIGSAFQSMISGNGAASINTINTSSVCR